MKRELIEAARLSDVVHSHGLWMMPNVYSARAARGGGKPYVLSPRGMLDSWTLSWSRYRKKLFWIVAQKRAVRVADCLHATSELEANAIRNAGLSAPIAVIPIGIDVPELSHDDYTLDATGVRTLLYLGRLHPKKNIEGLLESWSLIQGDHPDWRLRIVGAGAERYEGHLRELAKRLRLNRVTFDGPAFGHEKAEAFREADLFVLPTHSENFGVVVAEALSHGTPVIATEGAPWSGLETTGSGWWVESDVASLASAMRRAMRAERSTLAKMGTRGRNWMLTEFSWQSVAAQTVCLYSWLCGYGTKPSSVA